MRLTPQHYAQAWLSALNESDPKDWKKLSANVLQHVYQHGHIKWLPEIVRLVTALEHQKHGTTPVVVRSAHPLDETTLQKLVKAVLPNAKAVIEPQVDPRLLGGVQIETVNTRYNASIQSQLNQLAHTIQ